MKPPYNSEACSLARRETLPDNEGSDVASLGPKAPRTQRPIPA
jgi:hypothetical protein